MIYFTAHTFKCVCHCRRVMFRVLGMYNFETHPKVMTNMLKKVFNWSEVRLSEVTSYKIHTLEETEISSDATYRNSSRNFYCLWITPVQCSR